MQITITGHHLDITESLRDYVNEKLARLERHFDQVTNIDVVLTVEKLRQMRYSSCISSSVSCNSSRRYASMPGWKFLENQPSILKGTRLGLRSFIIAR